MAFNEMGFDPDKKYAPLRLDAFDDKQLFGTDTYDILVEIDLLKYDEYYLVKEFIIQNIFNDDYDFSIMEDMDEEAIFTIIYCRPDKNPLKCFMRNTKDKDLDAMWSEFKLDNRDRVFKYVKTELYSSIVNIAINADVGNVYILCDDITAPERIVTEGELLENVNFRRDKIKFIYSKERDFESVYKNNISILNKTRIFIVDDIPGIIRTIDADTSNSFMGMSFIIPKRHWNVYPSNSTLGIGKMDRLHHDFDIYSIEKFIDVKVINLINIDPRRDLIVG
ncbi:MAG: hypothetical protein ACRC0G_07785 [Fusobacteriaceae bacterium]